jgi:hypothetical protein
VSVPAHPEVFDVEGKTSALKIGDDGRPVEAGSNTADASALDLDGEQMETGI